MHLLVRQTVVQPSTHQHLVVAVVRQRVQINQQVGFVVSDLRVLFDHALVLRVLLVRVRLQHQALDHASVLLHQRQPFQLAVEHQLLHLQDSIVLLIPEQPFAVVLLSLVQSFQRLLQHLGLEDPSVLEFPVELHQVVQPVSVVRQPVQLLRLPVVLEPAVLVQQVLFEVRPVRLDQQLFLSLRFQPDLTRCQTVHQLHAVVAVQQVADQSSEHQLIILLLALRLELTCPEK